MAVKKCPICKKSYPDIDKLSDHIETKHGDELPNGYTGAEFVFFKNHGRVHGYCVECKQETKFNHKTHRPNRYCGNPQCIENYKKKRNERMMKVYNKLTLLNDPEHQNKMMSNRSIAKQYKWSDGTIKNAIGSYEYDCLQFLDTFLDFPSEDVIFPAPFTIPYKSEGVDRFYIPDGYIPSLNLILEIKESTNTHHKIQSVDRVKTKDKENSLKALHYNYVKILDKKYGTLINTIRRLKNMDYVGGINDIKYKNPIIISEGVNIDTMVDAVDANSALLESFCNTDKDITDVMMIKFTDARTDLIIELGIVFRGIIYCWRNDMLQTDYLANANILDVVSMKSDSIDYDALCDILHDFKNHTLTNPLDEDLDYDDINAIILMISTVANIRGLKHPFDEGMYQNISSFADLEKYFNPVDSKVKQVMVGANSENSALSESAIDNEHQENDVFAYENTRVLLESKVEEHNSFLESYFGGNVPATGLSGFNNGRLEVSDINKLYNKDAMSYVESMVDSFEGINKDARIFWSMKKDVVELVEGTYSPLGPLETYSNMMASMWTPPLDDKYDDMFHRLHESIILEGKIDLELLDERERYINELGENPDIEDLVYLGVRI